MQQSKIKLSFLVLVLMVIQSECSFCNEICS